MKTKNILKLIGLLISINFIFACTSVSKITLEKFITNKPNLYVCPVHILSNQESSFDTISAKAIVEYINEKEYATASLTHLRPPANSEWRANEAIMVTASNKLFTEFVHKNKFPDNTFILYAEFLKSGQNTNVRAVHYYLLSNKGEIAMRGLINSVWKEFQEVNPKTNDDCVAVFMKGFEQKMNSN